MEPPSSLSSDGPYRQALAGLLERHEALLDRRNAIDPDWYNGLFERYRHPVLTPAHTPLFWRYDLDPRTNPSLIEHLGINAVFNPGAILLGETIYLMCRLEGHDRKSFFAVAESTTGIDGFRFWPRPVEIPETDEPDTNRYDMRLVPHEDGWIYGLFCAERKHPQTPPGDISSAIAQCGIARTHDLQTWHRLPDLKTPSPQQRNVVLHPAFVEGRYAFYTRPQDDFLTAGGGIGWGLCDDITHPSISREQIIDPKVYHTIKESKNGAGPTPIKTPAGWLHIAHGVRPTAAGLRYVLYAFLCDLEQPHLVTHRPGGYLLAPWKDERVGDVSNVVFCNGVVVRPGGEMFIYYASSDTRIHVATTTVEKMLDFVLHAPEDSGASHTAVQQRLDLIDKNIAYAEASDDEVLKRVLGHSAVPDARRIEE